MSKKDNRFTADYSDVEYVEGMSKHNPFIERALNYHCKKYFDFNYKSVFFKELNNEDKDDIFQESFIAFWENILAGKLYVETGTLFGGKGQPFSGRLTTYFMSIAKYKYYEWVRSNASNNTTDIEEMGMKQLFHELFDDDDDDAVIKDKKLSIISDCISHMSERCRQILTLFYYEMKTLDDIMKEITTFISKDALKTAKYKCTENLRESANAIYDRYIN